MKLFRKTKKEPVEKIRTEPVEKAKPEPVEKIKAEPIEKIQPEVGKTKGDNRSNKSKFSNPTGNKTSTNKSITTGSAAIDTRPTKSVVSHYSADPPKFDVGHFTITLDEVAIATGATKVHEKGITGKGVRVAIIDSGYFPHEYFLKKYPKANIQVKRLAVAAFEGANLKLPQGNEGEDLNGHGTAMVANVLAMAPDAEITMIVCASDMKALEYAFSLKPHVVSVSRGPTYGLGKGASNDPVARSSVLDDYKAILDKGMKENKQPPIVLDAVGNVGARGMLSLLPDIISVGGTYMDEKGKLAASDYTNAYTVPADIYLTPEERGKKGGGNLKVVTKTQLPDITGLCGTAAHPDYIALPTQPGSELENKGTPGWGLASGSSCATPQVAGACALLKQMNPNLTTSQALAALQVTGTQVMGGRGHVDAVSKDSSAQPMEGSGLHADGTWSRLIDVAAAANLIPNLPEGATAGDLKMALSLWHASGELSPQRFQAILSIVTKHAAISGVENTM